MPLVLVAIILCAVSAGPIAGAESQDPATVAGKMLVEGSAYDLRRVQALTQRMASMDQAIVWCVWYESTGDWPSIADKVCPELQKQRAAIARQPYLVTTCVESLARTGDLVAARTILAEGDWSGTGAQPALGFAAAGRIAVIEHAWKDAAEQLKRARAALTSTESDGSPPWQIVVARKRIDRLRQDLDHGQREQVLGPDYLAWRAAEERAGSGKAAEAIAAYDRVVADFPTSRFAGPAALEAARAAWRADMAQECRRRLGLLLAKNDVEVHGFAGLLAADAEIRFGGNVAAIRQVSQGVLDWATSRSDPVPLPDAMRAEIQPTHAPHRFTRWNAPEWSEREQYRVWSWSTAPWARDYLTYQAMTRLVIAAVVAGDRAAAASYAQGMLQLDEVDRSMVQEGRPAGPLILAAAIKEQSYLLPIGTWSDMAVAAKVRTAAALVYYQLYDWSTARLWGESALTITKLGDKQHRDALEYLIGFTWHGDHASDTALTWWGKVGADTTVRPDEMWALARLAAFSVLHQREAEWPEAARMVLQIPERMPGTPAAATALMRYINASESRDPVGCKRACSTFLAAFPTSPYQTFVAQTHARLQSSVTALPPEPKTKP